MIARRALAVGAAAAMLAARARAQDQGRVHRVLHFGPTSRSEELTRLNTLPELQRLGFALGRNLVFEGRQGGQGEMPRLARELVDAQPDVVIAIGARAVQAIAAATATVPIVMFADDPVALGVADSLSRPGRNVTGIANLVVELQAKRLELLIEAIPASRHVGALLKGSSPTVAPLERALAETAARAGVALTIARIETMADLEAAFARLRAAGVEAVAIGPDPELAAAADRLVALATQARVALSCEWPDMAQSGCLIGYGADLAATRRRLAHIVARVLRGAQPADLPIEQPAVFGLTINQRSARLLGIDLPTTLLARADEVIE